MTEKEYCIQNEDKRLYGFLYLPDAGVRNGEEKLPLIISSHGFNGSYIRNRDYAERMTGLGFAFYCFDFYGGSLESLSGGSMTEMSVLTEAGDLEAVLRHFRQEDLFDSERIWLWGNSQGGYVSTYLAGKYPDWVRGLILLYPAYVIQDIVRDFASSFPAKSDSINHWDARVGRIYVEDAMTVDIYAMMERFSGKVLIVHGDKDDMVPVRYSREAAKFFPDVRLHILQGAGHGFEGDYREKMKDLAEEFLQADSW